MQGLAHSECNCKREQTTEGLAQEHQATALPRTALEPLLDVVDHPGERRTVLWPHIASPELVAIGGQFAELWCSKDSCKVDAGQIEQEVTTSVCADLLEMHRANGVVSRTGVQGTNNLGENLRLCPDIADLTLQCVLPLVTEPPPSCISTMRTRGGNRLLLPCSGGQDLQRHLRCLPGHCWNVASAAGRPSQPPPCIPPPPPPRPAAEAGCSAQYKRSSCIRGPTWNAVFACRARWAVRLQSMAPRPRPRGWRHAACCCSAPGSTGRCWARRRQQS
mmetsp:Transcript_56173/g.180296  ORF Transcript_56173/g.180296 Transcript_56173/m.180296 type:complete len:276 (-) Transcript_56173:84-911(-)